MNIRKDLLNLLTILFFFNSPLALSDDKPEIENIYYQFSIKLMPLLYESVTEAVQNHSYSDGEEYLTQVTESAYRLWKKNIAYSHSRSSITSQKQLKEKSDTSLQSDVSTSLPVNYAQLLLLYPSAMLIYKLLSPTWVAETLIKRQDAYDADHEFDYQRPIVHQIIDRLLDTWGIALSQNLLFFPVKKQFNAFFNCTYHDCSVMAEALNQAEDDMEKATIAYLDCRKRTNSLFGKHLFHICDLILHKPSSFVRHTHPI